MSTSSPVPHCRQIVSLSWAEFTTDGPIVRGKGKVRACVRKGLGYEKKVGNALEHWNANLPSPGEVYRGQWILFSDANGIGRAQPDLFIVWPELILLVEVKLTQTDAASDQLLGLYYPLLNHIFGGRRVVLVQACHNLRVRPRRRVAHPAELVASPRRGVWTWHYLG